MIKLVIFDIDNTLIDFPKNYEKGYSNVLKKFGLDYSAKDLYDAIGKYELDSKNKFYDKHELLNTINNTLKLNLGMDFMNEYFKMYDKLITEVSQDTIDTLKYLKSKYRLVTLSNWFTDSQKSRLKEAKILEYFDEVYGTDKVPMKPQKSSYLSVIGDLKLEECIMIGDNLEIDIKVPCSLGFNVYYLSKHSNTKYPTIENIKKLKEML